MIHVNDPDNYLLGLHAHYKGQDSLTGFKEYSIQSFKLKEGINAKEGDYMVTVTWNDLTTGQSTSMSGPLSILSRYDFYIYELEHEGESE